MCEPISELPKCRYFRDITWTYINDPDNGTQQKLHCICPKNSVAYIIKQHAYQATKGVAYQYSFACSPQSVSIHLYSTLYIVKNLYIQSFIETF